MNAAQEEPVEAWHVLVCGLPLAADVFDLGSALTLRRILTPLTIFDLAAVGAVGFRAWAALEPLAPLATAEIVSPVTGAAAPGYDALNKCWLASAMLVIRGYAGHTCPAASAYSWNFIAGHQVAHGPTFREQMAAEGVEKAVFEPRRSLPPFRGRLLEYHLRLFLPKEIRSTPFDTAEAAWISSHFEAFNRLAATEERFRFALEAAIDWRYARDARAAVARVWSGVESVLAINAELVYRVALCAATIVAPRGPERSPGARRARVLQAAPTLRGLPSLGRPGNA
jgi:hypothetical protein